MDQSPIALPNSNFSPVKEVIAHRSDRLEEFRLFCNSIRESTPFDGTLSCPNKAARSCRFIAQYGYVLVVFDFLEEPNPVHFGSEATPCHPRCFVSVPFNISGRYQSSFKPSDRYEKSSDIWIQQITQFRVDWHPSLHRCEP